MSKSLYVGNLPWTASEEELTNAFSAHGQVISSRIIKDRETNRSKGFAFVEVDDAAASKMIEAMNGAQFGGRPLVVNEARPKTRS